LSILSDTTNIFDVIYQPLKTELILLAKTHKLQHLNGSEMNIEQAVLAFSYANPKFQDLKEIKAIMLQAVGGA
jgi:shikimate 5-dehydrogenase